MSEPLSTPDGSGPNQLSDSYLGHPRGLFVLFFVEMWERFSYYGMRSLLVFYMIKGFLALDDSAAYGIYGAYTALVYATPFLGGMLADKLLGQRRAVILGGLLMAGGHLLMTIEDKTTFSVALAMLICGNGFFKPNISTMVGAMYPAGSPKRDGGFTIFYMGINLGAAMAPLICGYVGQTYGWHWGFGLATIGMLAGLMTFVANARLAQTLIGLTAFAAAIAMVWFGQDSWLLLGVNAPVGIALLGAGAISIGALMNGGLPSDLGAAKDPARIRQPFIPGLPLSQGTAVYLGTVLAIAAFAFLVQNKAVAGVLLSAFGGLALVILLFDALRSEKVERERLFVVLILTFFSMLFWAFFEQAGSSLNNFADRNVDRLVGARVLTMADVGQELTDVPVTSAFCGRTIEGKLWTLTDVDAAQKPPADDAPSKADYNARPTATLRKVTVTPELVGMKVGGTEIKASLFQAVNAICIVTFGLLFSMFWTFLGRRGLEPNTAVKFALGLFQVGLGFGALWLGTRWCSAWGFVGAEWLVLGYVIHTTGELCLSPVGLSMVTKLSPARMVSTVMGGWFMATAFANFLAGWIAALTGVKEGGGLDKNVIPPPIETVHVYGDVFGKIAVAGCVAGLLLLVLSPLLVRWMHAKPDDLRPQH